MDDLHTTQDELRKDEAMEREIEGTRQQLAKELAEYLDRKEVFGSVDELQAINRKIADVEGRLAENFSEKESITTRIKQRKMTVAAIIKKRFETQDGPAMTKQIHAAFLDTMKLAATHLTDLESAHRDMMNQNEKLQARSMDVLGRAQLKGNLWVKTVGDLIGHWRHYFGLADNEDKR